MNANISINNPKKLCVVCKYWYDPANSALIQDGNTGWFKYDTNTTNMCTIRRCKKYANGSCEKFECKFPR